MRFVVRMRGRERAVTERWIAQLVELTDQLEDIGVSTGAPKLEGGGVTSTVEPRKARSSSVCSIQPNTNRGAGGRPRFKFDFTPHRRDEAVRKHQSDSQPKRTGTPAGGQSTRRKSVSVVINGHSHVLFGLFESKLYEGLVSETFGRSTTCIENQAGESVLEPDFVNLYFCIGQSSIRREGRDR